MLLTADANQPKRNVEKKHHGGFFSTFPFGPTGDFEETSLP